MQLLHDVLNVVHVFRQYRRYTIYTKYSKSMPICLNKKWIRRNQIELKGHKADIKPVLTTYSWTKCVIIVRLVPKLFQLSPPSPNTLFPTSTISLKEGLNPKHHLFILSTDAAEFLPAFIVHLVCPWRWCWATTVGTLKLLAID